MTVLADHGAPLGVSTWRAFNSAATARADMPVNSERIGAMARARSREAGFGVVADYAAFHRGIDVDHECVGARRVAGHEINLAL